MARSVDEIDAELSENDPLSLVVRDMETDYGKIVDRLVNHVNVSGWDEYMRLAAEAKTLRKYIQNAKARRRNQ